MVNQVIKEDDAVKEIKESSTGFFKYALNLKKHLESDEVEQMLGHIRLLTENLKDTSDKVACDCPLSQQGWETLKKLFSDIDKPFHEFTDKMQNLHVYLCGVKNALDNTIKENIQNDIENIQNDIEKSQNKSNEYENEVEKAFERVQKDIDDPKISPIVKKELIEQVKLLRKAFENAKQGRKELDEVAKKYGIGGKK